MRSKDSLNDGKVRVREFYNMTPEEAYKLFEAIAQINGLEDKLEKHVASPEEQEEEKQAKKAKLSSFRFSMCNIKPGEQVISLEYPEVVCTVIDDRHISYEGEDYLLSSLACVLLGVKSIAGPQHFTYSGKILADLRAELNSDE